MSVITMSYIWFVTHSYMNTRNYLLYTRALWGDAYRLYASVGCIYMITLSNGKIYRVTGPLCGEFTGHR